MGNERDIGMSLFLKSDQKVLRPKSTCIVCHGTGKVRYIAVDGKPLKKPKEFVCDCVRLRTVKK